MHSWSICTCVQRMMMMYTVAAVAMRVASKRCMLLIGDVIKYVAVMVATDMSMNGAISLIAELSG